MTIFNNTDLNKTVYFFNRLGTNPVSILLTNEATNISTSFNIDSLVNASYYDLFNFTVTSGYFIENNFYYFKILDANNDILFQDKLFVTNQTITDNSIYDINKDKYISNVTINEYKIYE